MTRSQFMPCVDAGILMQLDGSLDKQTAEDLQVAALYAQLAADKAFCKGAEPVAWYEHLVAAMQRFGFDFPTAESAYFTAPAGSSQTLSGLLAHKWSKQTHWPEMAALLQSMLHVPASQAGYSLLTKRSVFQTHEVSSVFLLLWHVAASGEVDQWFVRLQTRGVVGPNLFTEAFDAQCLIGPVRINRHAGYLGQRFAKHREPLLTQLVEQRKALLLQLTAEQEPSS